MDNVPAGNVVVVTDNAGLMTIDKGADAECVSEPVTVAVKELVAAVSGVPPITPVLELSERLCGRLPEDTDHV